MSYYRAALLALFLCSPLTASQLPLRAYELGGSAGASTWILDTAALEALQLQEATGLQADFPQLGPNSRMHLRRLSLDRLVFPWSLDGVPRQDLLDDSLLSCWVGTIDHDPNTHVQLSFSRFGCYGSLAAGGQLWALDGLRGVQPVRWREVTQVQTQAPCTRPPAQAVLPATRLTPAAPLQAGCGPREAHLAVEADGALFALLGGAQAEAAYVASLLLHAAHVLERDAQIALVVTHLALHTPAADPWSLPPGADCHDALQALQLAWPAGPPQDADLGLLFAGADLGCSVGQQGITSLGALGVLGSLTGQASFPPSTGPFLWDFFALCHTLGHNFGAHHTHEYCPPLDRCAPVQLFGNCQQEQDCSARGSLMSFCHLCPGGLHNIGVGYHPLVAGAMQQLASANLPPYLELELELAQRVLPGVPLWLGLATPRQQDAAPRVHFRYGPQTAWFERPMVANGPQSWASALPAAVCGQQFQLYFALSDTHCGEQTWPVDGANAPLLVAVEQLELFWSTDFEHGDEGWSAVDLGASTGDWERAIPLGPDPNWPFAPVAAASGQWCWVTDNSPAHVDVDGGAAGLQSPPMDLPEGPFAFSYSAYLGISTPGPGDHLSVWVMGPGSGGEWVQVAIHHQPALHASDWRRYTVTAEHLSSLGLSGGPQLRLRFVGRDSSPPSVVELGLDDVRIWAQACSPN